MKHFFQMLILLLSATALSAQADCRESVVSSAGTELSFQSWRLSFTVGEPAMQTLSAPTANRMLTQGFHQPAYAPCGTTGTGAPNTAFSQAVLSPNPTSGWVRLTFATPPSGSVRFSVSNLLGQVLLNGTTPDNPDELVLDCSACTAGLYVLVLEGTADEAPATFLFVKSTP